MDRFWAQSADRVLALRRIAALEREKTELIRILQEVEQRCAVVVNRQAHEVLKDVPSWKTPQCCSGEVNPRTGKFIHDFECKTLQKRKSLRVGGMTTFRDLQKRLERRLSVDTRKRMRREREMAEALGQAPARVSVPHNSDSEPGPHTVAVEIEGNGNVGA